MRSKEVGTIFTRTAERHAVGVVLVRHDGTVPEAATRRAAEDGVVGRLAHHGGGARAVRRRRREGMAILRRRHSRRGGRDRRTVLRRASLGTRFPAGGGSMCGWEV